MQGFARGVNQSTEGANIDQPLMPKEELQSGPKESTTKLPHSGTGFSLGGHRPRSRRLLGLRGQDAHALIQTAIRASRGLTKNSTTRDKLS